MGKFLLRIALTLLVLGAIGGVWYVVGNPFTQTQSTTTTETLTQIITVTQGDLNAIVSVVGQLDAPQSQTMRFDRLAGTANLLTLELTAGNLVTTGQRLATIDPTPYQQAVDAAQNDRQAAQTTLADLQTPPSALEIAQANLAIAQTELARQQAEQALDDLSNPDLASLQSDVANAQLKLSESQANLASESSDSSTADQLLKLKNSEGTTAAELARLGKESYSDAYYEDRLRLANNAYIGALDARMSAEIQRQIDLLNAQINLRKAEQSVVVAQKKLRQAQTGSDELAIAIAQQAVAQSVVDIAQARQDRADLDAGADETALASAQAAITKQEQAVAAAEADLAAATLRAPFAGTILQTNAIPGTRITASSIILTLADLDQLQVVAAIDETTIRQIKTGQPVQISFDAFAGQQFRGEVLAVPLQGTLQGDVMVYAVPISLVGAEELPLLVGMTANLKIQVGQAKNALLLPKMALQSLNGVNQVLIPNRSDPTAAPEIVPVEVGMSDGVYSEIISGLNAGDSVVVQVSAADTTNVRFAGGGGGLLGGLPGGNVTRGNRIR